MLINCVAYRNGQRVADIARNEIRSHLDQGNFVWVALRDPDFQELEHLQREFNLHALAVEDAYHGNQRPKVEEYGDLLFVVMHTVEPDEEDGFLIGEINVFVGHNFLLSVRKRTSRGFADVRARCEREPELFRHGPGYVLYTIMDAVVDRYFPMLESLEEELEELEAQLFTDRNQRVGIEALYGLKRKLMTLRHATSALTEASMRLFGGRVPAVCMNVGEYFRDVYDHLVRLNADLDTIREMVTTAISVNVAMISLSENEVTKRLAAYAALVAVPTLIAGIYGMNFTHMPEIDWTFGYPMSIAAMVGIDAVLAWRFRRAGWL